MLLFLGEYPTADNEKDGALQLIARVDESFVDIERTYLSVSFKHNLALRRSKIGKVTSIKANAILHCWTIAKLIIMAKVIYVHSVYSAMKTIWFLLITNGFVVFEVHGIVPEELRLLHEYCKSYLFAAVEKMLAIRANVIIVVTNQMKRHLIAKYKKICAEVIIKPNVQQDIIPREAGERSKRGVIYAGGNQTWQQPDKMICYMSMVVTQLTCTILSPKVDYFRSKLEALGIEKLVSVRAVPRENVYEYYARNDFGLIFRQNNAVNRVACPTKMMEYFAFGLVPVVEQPEIGDFAEMGYSYVLMDDDLAELSKKEIIDSVENNYRVLRELSVLQKQTFARLREVVLQKLDVYSVI